MSCKLLIVNPIHNNVNEIVFLRGKVLD